MTRKSFLANCFTLIFILLTFTACSFFAPKFDADSTEDFSKSYDKIVKQLSNEERDELNAAMLVLVLNYVKEHPMEALVGVAALAVTEDKENFPTQKMTSGMMKLFDGKTASDVVKEAKELTR